MKKLLIFSLMVIFSFKTYSEELGNGWSLNGYGQLIPYMDGRDFSNDTYAQTWTSSKLRVGVEKIVNEHFSFVMKIQDSRIWGENASVMDHYGNTGLIEGYVKYSNIFDEPLSLQAGRFQMAYGNGRFIHTSPWNYHERTFDGARASYNPDNFSIDLFYTTHTNSHEYKLNARPGDYPYPAEDYDGYEIFGLWGKSMISDKSELNLFAFRESNSEVGESGEALIDQTTFGTSYYGRYGKLSTDLDFGYQIGTRDDMDVAAYLASFKLAYQFEPVKVHAGTDWHSGTAPDDLLEENNTFDNYIAAKHRFFGNMDYFTAARGLYNGLGVNDYYAGLTFGGKKTDWMFMANFHYFMSNQESASGESAYGQEIDLVLRYNVTRGVFVEWGGGVFFQGELMKKFYELPGDTVREDLGFMSYLRTFFNI